MAEFGDIDLRYPTSRRLQQMLQLIGFTVRTRIRRLTCVPISGAVLENIPPMLATASAMMTALMPLVTTAVVLGEVQVGSGKD